MSQKQIQRTKKKYQMAGAFFFTALFITVFALGFSIKPEYVNVEATTPTNTEIKPTNIVPEADGLFEVITVSAKADEPKTLYYNIPLSEQTQDYIFELSERYGVPSEVIIAIIQRESNYNQYATGSVGEQGYMQIHPCNNASLRKALGITDFYDTKQNILCGVYMLSGLFEKYDTVNKVLMAYNCGEAGAKRLWKKGITETSYSRKIQSIMNGLTTKEANNEAY